MIEVWTDGACRGNGKKKNVGGYAYVIVEDDQILDKYAAAAKNTTNNQMELLAVVEGLNKVQSLLETNKDYNPFLYSVVIYTDSAYIHNCWKNKWYSVWRMNGWKNSSKEPVKNKELWEQLIPYFDNIHYEFKKVKGHAGNYYNEMVDKLATSAADGMEG